MRYPITPDFLESAPESIVRLYQDLEEAILSDICRRFRLSGEATETALEQIRTLRRRGIPLEEIERRIQKTLEPSQKEFDEIFQRAVDRNQAYFDGVISKADILSVAAHRTALQQEAAAIQAQTRGEFTNITRSLGFALRTAGKVEFQPIAKAYQKVLDDAEIQVWSGAVDYNTAVRNAVRRLSDSGLQTVDYASGWHNRVDVAARRAVMTGINQLSDQYSDQIAGLLGTEYFEISAHSRARDIDGPKGGENHKKWQGRVYYRSKNGESDPRGEYPDLVKSTGYGYVDGLSGANCRHKKFSFVPGVSERTYTDEELDNIDPPPFTYQGRTYTAYQATQKQRQLETAMRDCKRKMAAYKAAGLSEEEQAVSIRLRRLNAEYRAFSKAAGLTEQRERMRVYAPNEKSVETSAMHSIIEEKDGGVSTVQTIGKIDIEKYRVVSDSIRTDEVIITDERIQHIKDRHPTDYERFVSYIPQILDDPDYIVEANKLHTAVILKEVLNESFGKFKLILRLSVPGDPEEYKNSIISFWEIGETTWRKTLKNKNILYKKE